MSSHTQSCGLEIKLTALPDNAICDLEEEHYGSELVVRPDTIAYLACSLAHALQDRHYAHYALQIVPRTLRMQLDILEKVGLISLIKGKHRYAYIYLKDYRKLESYQSVGLNQKPNIPTPFFLAILAYVKKIAQALKGMAFRVKGRHGLFAFKSPKDRGRMRRFNDVILEFSPLDDPNTTISITYQQLTGKQIPSMKCFYQVAIVKKNLKEALESWWFKDGLVA